MARWRVSARSGPGAGGGDLGQLAGLTAVVFALMALVTGGRFLSLANLESLGFQFPELALLSLAVMFSMLSGGIDLSIVAVANLSGLLAALVLTRAIPEGAAPAGVGAGVLLAIATGLAAGAACGGLNGLLVSRLGIPPILATLGTLQLHTGLALVISGGKAVHGFPPLFLALGNGSLLGVPAPLLFYAAVLALLGPLSARGPFAWRARLVGSSPRAASFAGIRVGAVHLRTYLLSGVIAAVAGLLMVSRTNSARADYGASYLLEAILVALLAGVDPAGGRGSVLAVSLAVLALEFLASGFQFLRFSNFATEFVWGAFLLAIMAIRSSSRRPGGGRRPPPPERSLAPHGQGAGSAPPRNR